MPAQTLFERAMQLAETGSYPDMQRLERQLEREGFENPDFSLTGAVRKKISAVCRQSHRSGSGNKS